MTVLGTDLNAPTLLDALPAGVHPIEVGSDRAVFSVEIGLCSVSTAVAFLSAHAEIRDLTVEDPSLDQIVSQLYEVYRV
jgi:hypothetical protein